MAYHLELGYAQSRKGRPLLDYELGDDRRHYRCNPNWLERWWQRQRRMVLLAQRALEYLVLI